MNSHLTHEQLCDLLIDNLESNRSKRNDQSREHLSTCAICAGELAALRQSLSLFRSTADAWADHAWSAQPVTLHRKAFREPNWRERLATMMQRPVVWSAAAAAAILAVALPLAMHHAPEQRDTADTHLSAAATTPTSPSVNEDEALLLEINQTLSSSVPSPMQPLADPTSTAAESQSN